MKAIIILSVLFVLMALPMVSATTVQITPSATLTGASQDAQGNYYVTEGNSFTLTVSVANEDTSTDATSVEATVSLPSGLSTTDSVTKSIGTITAGSSESQTWTVTGDVAGNYLNAISISVSGSNTNSGSTATGLTVKASPTIVGGISCAATDSKVINTDFDVTVTVQNLGDLEATGISVALSASPSVTVSSSPQSITSITGGSSESVTFSSLSADVDSYTFTATVTSSNAGSDTATCTTETVASLPNGYVCSSSSQCSSGCCSSSLCAASGCGGTGTTVTATGGGGGSVSNRTNQTQSQNQNQTKTASKKPELVPGVGLRTNTNLQAAIEKVLAKGQMSEQAKENLMRLSESVTAQVQAQMNFEYDGSTTKVENRFTYQGRERVKNMLIHDTVPKEFAANASIITVTAPGATIEIVNEDPEYLIFFPQVDPNQEIVITYSVNTEVSENVLDSFGTEIYAESTEEMPICSPGERKCEGNIVQECSQDGYKWNNVETCQELCSDGKCTSYPTEGIEAPAFPDLSQYTLYIIIAVIVAVVVVVGALAMKKKGGRKSRSFAPRTFNTLR